MLDDDLAETFAHASAEGVEIRIQSGRREACVVTGFYEDVEASREIGGVGDARVRRIRSPRCATRQERGTRKREKRARIGAEQGRGMLGGVVATGRAESRLRRRRVLAKERPDRCPEAGQARRLGSRQGVNLLQERSVVAGEIQRRGFSTIGTSGESGCCGARHRIARRISVRSGSVAVPYV